MKNNSSRVRWIYKEVSKPEKVKELQKSLNIGKIFATILVNRGIFRKDDAIAFLNPRLQSIHDPYQFYDMRIAVDRIIKAIKEKEKIYVYGDYDVDGVTSTSLLYKCFVLLKADANYYIPHRLSEGYGMNVDAVRHLHSQGAKLIVTADCGIRGHESVSFANELGIDVVVTDHHEVGDELPPAVAIINPKDRRGEYPFKGICGVGVVFKLAWALFMEYAGDPTGQKVRTEHRKFLTEVMELVAMGTIADVAPLMGENRAMTRYGLVMLKKSKNVGIQMLKETARLPDGEPITPEHVGFRLGPRINAMGRLSHSKHCVELLITGSKAEASELAKRMEGENRRRRSIQEEMEEEALEQVTEERLQNSKVLVLYKDGWHPGVIGIVASTIQARYYRPVFMIAVKDGVGKASARSIPGFNLVAALENCKEHLVAFGGHELAAGFQVQKEKIELLEAALSQHADQILTEEQMRPFIEIETEVSLSDLTWELHQHLEMLAPFGESNPKPIFATKQIEIVKNPKPDRCGSKGEHLRFRVRQANHVFKVMAFGKGELWEQLMENSHCDLTFVLKKNSWGGNCNLELEAKDIILC